MNTNEAKEIRGFILTILKVQYPSPASDRLISLTLNDSRLDSSIPKIRIHLRYLEEKGYVRTEEGNELGIQRTMATLTAKGIDLLDGSIADDPGVMVIR
ncbi:hypothetical protein [Paenibacillus tyrfis]|uniref:Uncharacterized protein n=1 Tax=Paenibacillus tyrfis TaxID=1501230 RepID=A0A081NY96_9BACL|nr:hypothetical protein [Paenibacillus tyrfis]KEQ23419.1 hypothetical protein ET33_16435 [Paenibacillus tyrfis]